MTWQRNTLEVGVVFDQVLVEQIVVAALVLGLFIDLIQLILASQIVNSHRVGRIPLLRKLLFQTLVVDSDEFVGVGDQVQVRVLAVVKVGVRLPYLLQHPVTDRQSFEVARKTQTTIDPALTEVAVELVGLSEKCACA